MSISRFLRASAGVLIACSFAYASFRDVKLRELFEVVSLSNPLYISLAILTLLLDYCLRCYRWYIVIKTSESQAMAGAVSRAMFIGTALNNILPLRAGDIYRAIHLKRKFGIGIEYSTTTILVERIFDFFTLLLLLLCTTTIFLDSETIFPFFWQMLVAVMAFVTIAAVAFPSLAVNLLGCSLTVAEEHSFSRIKPVLKFFHRIALSLRSILSPKITAHILGVSILIWGLEGLVFQLAAESIGLHHPFIGLSSMCLSTFATLIPGAPGNIGTQDYFIKFSALSIGYSELTSVTYAALAHFILWLPLTILGILLSMFESRSVLKFNASDSDGTET